MATFHNDVVGVWQFSNSLVDEVSNNDFNLIESGVLPSYSQFQRYDLLNSTVETRNGLKLEAGKIFRTESITVLDSGPKFSIAFTWFSPAAVGYTRHAITRNKTTKVIPILGKGDTDEGSPFENVRHGEFIVSEVAASETQNAIQFEVCMNNFSPTHSYLSSAYDPGLHTVYILYDSSTGIGGAGNYSVLYIFIDGQLDTTYGVPNGKLNNTHAPLYLNQLYNGFTDHKSIHEGAFIADLVIKNNQSSYFLFDSIKYARLGWESISDINELVKGYGHFGVGFSQASTVTTNQIYVTGGNIYAARSNGEILKGHRPIWDTESDYKNAGDETSLTSDKPENIERTSAGLKITGTTVRI